MNRSILSIATGLSGLLLFSLGACGKTQSKVEVPIASSNSPEEKPLGTKPVIGPEGMPLHCEIMVDKLCYMSTKAACAAADCPMASCVILDTYPGQVGCEKHKMTSAEVMIRIGAVYFGPGQGGNLQKYWGISKFDNAVMGPKTKRRRIRTFAGVI